MPKRVVFSILCLFIFIYTAVAESTICSVCASPEEETTLIGNEVSNGLAEEDGYYRFYENGIMAKDKWLDIEGNKYYFKKNGNAAVLKCKIKGRYYIFNDKGQLIMPSSKKMVSINTSDGTKKYYVNPDGTARSGWTKDKKYYFNKDMEIVAGIVLIKKKLYCFKTNGKINTGKTKKIQKAAKRKKPFSVVKKLIGKPNKSKYYASCYGNGKDGVLRYKNFTVYTFKPARGTEIFMNVE